MPPPSKSQDPSHTPARRHRARAGEGSAFFEGKHDTIQTQNDPFSAPQAEDGAFFQPKLNIHPAYDVYEAEAERMADRVVDRAPAAPVIAPPVQRQAETEEAVQEKPLINEISRLPTDTAAAAQRMPAFFSPGEMEQNSANQGDVQSKSMGAWKDTTLQRREEDEVQTQTSPDAQARSEAPAAGFEQRLQSTKGGGSALPAGTRRHMESGFGVDFSGVRVHTDPSAVQMNREIGAQAFTHGNSIYFNAGKYNPGTRHGDHLLAHELTHTVQQGASSTVQQKTIQKTPADAAGGTTNPGDILKTFYLPAVKARHLQLYQAWASGGKLKRIKNYSRDTSPEDKPDQVTRWKNDLWDKMQIPEHLGLHADFSGIKQIGTPGNKKEQARRRGLLKKFTIPDWDKSGVVLTTREDKFQVDHMVELQIAGWPSDQTGNDFPNLELLDGNSNTSAGGKTRGNIEKIVRNFLEASALPNTQSDAQNYMRANDLTFERVEIGVGDFAGNGESSSKYWTREEIVQGMHLGPLEDLGNIGEPGSPTEFALMTPDDGYLMELYPHTAEEFNFSIAPDNRKSKSIAGLKISQISLLSGYDALNPDANMGSLTVAWDLPANFNAPPGTFPLPLLKSQNQYAGKAGSLPQLGLNFSGLSPVSFSGLEITEAGLSAEGRLVPSLPFLENTLIRVGVRGREIYFRGEFSPSNIKIPIPGIKINSSTFYVEYSTETGFGVGGDVELEIPKIAVGTISSGFTQAEGLFFRGNIVFDRNLFGNAQASARLAYENNAWSAGGTLAIPANTVRGIKSALINVDYTQEHGFTAVGTAELEIPGIDRGSMEVAFNEQGFSIRGEFNLKPNLPGIRSGRVEASVSKSEGSETYNVLVTGTAQPDIPGINSTLAVTYDNGALTITGSASYNRGMLSGTVNVGATNRAIGDDGQPTGDPDDTIRVYGGGSLTLQLTPWLAATAGVKFLPNGEMEVTARLSTDTYTVFARKEYDRNLFTVPTIEIPLFAIPLGPRSVGLVAQIGGGLDFKAGFGPGQLKNLSAEITYNPDHEENTTVRGHGEFVIPADASLVLRGNLSLGVSVAIASLTGGIELAGTLGLQGEAGAAVDVNWSPQTGLTLDASGRIMVSPRFTFDINAFARASLGVGVFSISKTWRHNLASFTWGPDIQFGIVFPVHYREGETFNMSFDDIQVIYPDIQIIEMSKGLAQDIKNDIFD